MIDNTKKIQGFIVLDPINNVQEYITQVDIQALRQAQAAHCVLLVEYMDGTRDVVEPEEVDLSIIGDTQTIHIVQQEVYVPMMNALLELMEETAQPVASISAMSAKPVKSKLAVFKELVENMNEKYMPNLEGK